MLEKKVKSIYDEIGFKGLCDVVWQATPWYIAFSFPCGLYAYHDILQRSNNLDDLFNNHKIKYKSSHLFKLFRPRHHKAEEILREKYSIN